MVVEALVSMSTCVESEQYLTSMQGLRHTGTDQEHPG